MLVIVLAGCLSQGSAGEADAGSDAATDAVYDVKSEPPPYVNPSCPVSFSLDCPGSGDGGCAPYRCIPIPPECENNVTCACIACTSSTCGAPFCPYSTGNVGGNAECRYENGTFTVECQGD